VQEGLFRGFFFMANQITSIQTSRLENASQHIRT